MPKSYHRRVRRHARELGPQAIARASVHARDEFLKIGHFAPFPNFDTLRVKIFGMFFIRSRLPMTPMNHEKFMEIGWHVFQKSGRQTDSCGNFIYIDWPLRQKQ